MIIAAGIVIALIIVVLVAGWVVLKVLGRGISPSAEVAEVGEDW